MLLNVTKSKKEYKESSFMGFCDTQHIPQKGFAYSTAKTIRVYVGNDTLKADGKTRVTTDNDGYAMLPIPNITHSCAANRGNTGSI